MSRFDKLVSSTAQSSSRVQHETKHTALMDDQADNAGPIIKITYPFANKDYALELPIKWCFGIARLLGLCNNDAAAAVQMAFEMARIGLAATLTAIEIGPPDSIMEQGLTDVMMILFHRAQTEQWDSDTDVVLSCCYHLLANKSITHQQSVDIANELLPWDDPVMLDTWRIRVYRWARAPKRQLPPVQIHKSPAPKGRKHTYEPYTKH